MSLINTYRFISNHPLTRDRKSEAIARWIKWQISSRLSPFPAAVPFVNTMRLLVRSGMTGATGNVYCGLHEFEDMAFVMHFLRPGDLFADVGANIGAYSVLAAATGAHVISFEPVPSTFQALLDNVHLNRLAGQVDARPQAVGRSTGTVRMIADQDTTNQVLASGADYAGKTVDVPIVTLDQALSQAGVPRVMKIDVEGHESDVLNGAQRIFRDPLLHAVIVELNGSAERHGHSDEELHRTMQSFGFRSCAYDPIARRLEDANGKRKTSGNTLYVRSPQSAQHVLAEANKYRVLGRDV